VLLVGSPVYLDDDEPSFSFFNADADAAEEQFRLPTHGHVAVETDFSPFGLKGVEASLRGSRIYWWLTMGENFGGTRLFRERVIDFWNLYFSQQGGRLAQISSSGEMLVEDLLKGVARLDPVSFDVQQSSISMYSIVRGKPQYVVEVPKAPEPDVTSILIKSLPPVSDWWVMDQTASMGPYREMASRHISAASVSDNHYHSVILFNDDDASQRTAFVFSESRDPSEIMLAFRAVELVGGQTVPEALADGLALALDQLKKREQSEKSRFWIITDAPPRSATELVSGNDYRLLMRQILALGHAIEVLRCKPDQDLSWVPAGVTIADL
jgi:hypothetical protein